MIRILHTSDWHLGLETHGHERLAEQALFLDWLVETVVGEAVDALLVAGDVYDVVNPSVSSQSLFARFLVKLRERAPRCQVVVVAGNHDSGARLEIPRPFGMALGDIQLVGTFLPSEPARHAIRLRDASGTDAAWCLAVPFLRASDLDCRVQEGEGPEQAFVRALRSGYGALARACKEQDPALPVVAMGHLTVSGSERTGSERLLIGGVESIPVDALAEGADYVALGHIHRAQSWKDGAVRYCGSPLPIDFDERHGTQRVLLVELDGPGDALVVREIAVPRTVPMLRFPGEGGTWEDAVREIEAFDDTPWREQPTGLWPLVEIRYRADGPRPDLREQVETLLRGRCLRLAGLPRAIESGVSPASSVLPSAVDLKSREAPLEILERHFRLKYEQDLPDDLRSCFLEILDQVSIGGKA